MDFGGVESWLMSLLRQINRNDVRFDFLVHGQPGAHEREIERLGGRILRGADPHRPWAFCCRLREVLRNHGPYDVVHSHVHLYSGLVLWIAATARVPVRIAHGHNTPPAKPGMKRLFYSRLMRRLITRYATSGLAASRAARDNLYGDGNDPRWQILLFGLMTAPFRDPVDRVNLRRHLGIPTEVRVVGHVGRLVPQKNHDLILRVVAQIPDVWLLLVGDGELRPDLERQVNELGIARRTVFTGARADIPALLKTMDVFLFPSHFEGLGLAVVEAQAAGLPIVTADTIPPEAIIIHNACSILSLNDPISHWVEAIQKSHVKLGANPLDLIAASPFDQRVCLERLLAIYRGES